MKFDDIYVDMDGVLCDFMRNFLLLHSRLDLYDRCEDPNLENALEMSRDDLWEPVIKAGFQFWRDLPVFPWVEDLLQFASKLGDVTILTRPLNRVGLLSSLAVSQSTRGKLEWLQGNLGIHASDVILTSKKHCLARPGALLIEDIDEYCEPFRARGGQILIMPQSYNKYSDRRDDRMDAVMEQFELLKEDVTCS